MLSPVSQTIGGGSSQYDCTSLYNLFVVEGKLKELDLSAVSILTLCHYRTASVATHHVMQAHLDEGVLNM